MKRVLCTLEKVDETETETESMPKKIAKSGKGSSGWKGATAADYFFGRTQD